MANFRYYTQNSVFEASTPSDSIGTATGETNALNYQWQSKVNIATVTGAEYAIQFLLSSAAFQPKFLVIMNHNMFDETASVTFDAKTTDTGGGAYDLNYALDAVASNDIYFYTWSVAAVQKTYYRVRIGSTSANLEFANIFLGSTDNVFEPSTDPDLPRDRGWLRDGLIINQSESGSKFAVEKSDRRRVWSILYRHISTANKTVLEDLEEACGGGLKPFVFTDDGGTTYFYVRWDETSPLFCRELASGLWECSFRLIEEI